MLWLQPGPFLQDFGSSQTSLRPLSLGPCRAKRPECQTEKIFAYITGGNGKKAGIVGLDMVTLEGVKKAVSLQTCCKTRGSERAL